MLRSLLMEDPEALWRHNKKSEVLKMLAMEAGQEPLLAAQEDAADRQKQMFLAALSDLTLVPRADPNTSSQTERYLKVVAMRQMAETNQSIDKNQVDKRAFQVMGIDDAESFFKPPQQGGPTPEQIIAQSTGMAAQAKMLEAQTKARTIDMQLATKSQEMQSREKIAALGVAREMIVHNDNMGLKRQELQTNQQTKRADRLHDIVKTQMGHHASQQQAHGVAQVKSSFDTQKLHHQHVQGVVAKNLDHRANLQARGLELQHEHQQGMATREHESRENAAQREHDARVAEQDRAARAQEAKARAAQQAKKAKASKPKPKKTK